MNKKIEVIKNFTQNLIKMSKYIDRNFNIKLVKTLLLFCLIYQTIVLTLDYCHFEIVVDMRQRYFRGEFPSVTFCIDSKTVLNRIQLEISENITTGQFMQKIHSL